MTVLVVDDQKAIIDSLLQGVDFQRCGFDKVLTATSAKEAKLLIVNYPVDVLLTDIEMPGENGIELFCWVHKKYPSVVGIFLTSHSSFQYAQDALREGAFDYLLQPAKFSDVEQVLIRAVEVSRHNAETVDLFRRSQMITGNQDERIDLLMFCYKEEAYKRCDKIFDNIRQVLKQDFQAKAVYMLRVQVVRNQERWLRHEASMRFSLRSMLEEIFEPYGAKAIIGMSQPGDYYVVLSFQQEVLEGQLLAGYQKLEAFTRQHTEYGFAVYPLLYGPNLNGSEQIAYLAKLESINKGHSVGVYWEMDPQYQEEEDDAASQIRKAQKYICTHVNQSITRKDMEEILHLNGDYFSRLFKKETGYSFKDYVVHVKMDEARKLLEHSHFSIGIIASKVGYDNFSQFATSFK